MKRQPEARASNAKDYLAFIERAHPDVHRAVLRDVVPETLERIRTGLRTNWIPIEVDGPFVDASGEPADGGTIPLVTGPRNH